MIYHLENVDFVSPKSLQKMWNPFSFFIQKLFHLSTLTTLFVILNICGLNILRFFPLFFIQKTTKKCWRLKIYLNTHHAFHIEHLWIKVNDYTIYADRHTSASLYKLLSGAVSSKPNYPKLTTDIIYIEHFSFSFENLKIKSQSSPSFFILKNKCSISTP